MFYTLILVVILTIRKVVREGHFTHVPRESFGTVADVHVCSIEIPGKTDKIIVSG